METSSYDELVKKIASLQAENSHLRQYVHYKASHMTRLEQESSSMRDALSTTSEDNLAFNEEPSFSIDQSESRGAASSLAAFQVDRQQIGEEKRDSPAGLTNSALSKTVLLSDGSSSPRNIHSPQTFSSSAGRNESVHGQLKPPVLDQSKGDSLLFNQSQIIEALFPNKSQPASLDQLNSRDSAFGNYSYSALFDQSAGRESSFVSGAHSQPSSLGAVNHRTTSQNDSLPKPSSRHTSLPYFTHQSKQAFLDHLHVKTENKSSVLNQSKHGAFLDQSLKNGDASFLNQSNQAFLDQSQVVDQSHPAFLNQSNQAFLDQSQVLGQSHPGFLDQSQTQEGHEGGAEELDQNNSALNESTLRHAEAILSGDSALMAGDVRRMGLGQRLQSGAMATPTANSPGKRRNNNDRELYSYLQELDQQRTAILHDIESEDKLRKWYYEQLEVFTKKIESLPLTETYNLQADMNRRQLEHEIQKLRESLQENLGSSESIATRHEARLHKIHMIEREMLRLQQRHGQFQDQERPSSGPCDQIEPEREEMALVDACTNTSTAGEAFVPVNSEENTAYTSDRGVCCRDNGMRVITIATQTSEVVIPDFDSLPDIPVPHSTNMAAMFHGAWPITKGTALTHPETASVMSFNSSNSHGSAHSSPSPPKKPSNQQLGTKYPCFVAPQVEMVYSLLSMLGTHDKDDMSRTLLAMSSSQDSCIAMRQSGCMPLLIQLLHGSDKESGLLGNTRGSKPARARAAAALHNIVHSHPDDKRGRREARVLRLLEQIRAHCDQLRDLFDAEALEEKSAKTSDIDHHPGPAIAALMKLSFDEEHRHAICTLGGLQAIAELLEVDQLIHDNTSEQYNITMRRYACMALTNLTFGDGTNKALLCSMKSCMEALVAQLRSPNEDLCQVAASVLRNLSWRADLASKKTLREVGAVTTLMITAMVVKKESTLKSILSALWNLSAHCSENKADICAVENSLVFLGNTLTYKSPSKTLAIIENGGGILRNVSSHVAIREDYRKVLRQHGCLQILLKHLRSPSLTIVSNACGTLWNLSARCAEDQQALWDMGAVSMLKNLLHSKHKMISMGSAAALKNLLAARPSISANDPLDKQKTNMPSLHVRKQRALEAEIDQSLSETCENVDSPRDSPVDLIGKKEEHDSKRFLYSGGDNVGGFQGHTESEHRRSLVRGQFFPRSGSGDSSPLIENQIRSPQRVARSGSQDSVGSVHSDISHDRSRVQNMLAKSSKLLHERQGGSLDRRKDGHHNLQNCGSRSLDSAAEIYKARQGSPANSRIVQVMKEVALHAGLEGEYNRNHGNKGEKGQLREPPNRRLGGFQPPELKDTPALGQANAEVSDNGKNNERGKRDNLRSGEQDDQPVNYSMKYNNRTEEEQESREDPKNNQNFGSSLNNRPVPKVGNYVGSAFISQQEMPNMVRNNFPAPKNIQAERNFYNGKPPMSGSNKKLNALHETDYATDDQPTDYSRLYAEHSESDEHPVNYSSHYRDCADCKLEEARRTNDMLEQMMGDNDCVRTFYTEGTPLNYMSTATSMTDLSAHVHVHRPDANKSVMHQVPEDEAGAFSTHFEKEDNQNDGLSESVREVYNESQQERPAIAPESESHSPSEKPKTYCEEGTPICFSRVSSLSSLHSSDARDRNEASGKQGGELQSIDEAETSFEHGAKKRDKSVKPLGKEGISPGNVESPEKEHKTVTWDDNHQVQETPLMFSRCSSLGSLSSFDAHSVHSSVLSDYSRRPSGNVSPSDLPDSPSETMPPTPRCKSPSRAGGSASNYKGGETVLSSEENKTDTVKAAEAEERSRGAQKRNDELKLTTERSHREENIQMAEDLHTADDVPVTYATEDTPLNFSETTSLSGLSVCPEEETMIENPAATKETPKPKPWKSPVKTGKEEHEHDSSLSEVSEGEEDILAECISSAMPNNTNRRMKKSASDHAIKKKVGIFKIENLNQNKSKLPTKIINTTKAGPLSPPGAQRSIPVARKPPLPPAVDAEPDTTKSYATEGTPLNFSRTGSLSDISICTDRSVGKMVDPLERVAFEEDSKSDNSSFMDDHDDILSQVIQSAMPKGKSAKKSPSSSDLKDSKGAASKEKKQLSPAKRPPMKFRQDSETQFLTGGDTMKTFAVEGTPINFSTATSLSDLTMESFEGMDRKLSDQEENEQKVLSENVSMNATGNASILDSRLEDSVFLQDVAACDSPRVYGVEGTPMSFSRSDSLSSLGCRDEDDGGKKTHSAQPSAIPVKSKLPRRSNQRSLSKLPVASKSFLPTDHVKSDIESSLYQREVIGQSSEESSQADTLLDRDQTKKFEVEGTPYCFSRNSSLSSLHTDDNFTRDNSGEGDQLKVPESEANQKDHQADFKVEGTPVCFSLNSSLSSLSIESSPNAPTQYEQDLLEQCINSAMPKGKANKPTNASSIPRGIPRPGSKPNREKLPQRSPLHIRAEFDADCETPTNSGRPRGGDSDVFYNSPASPHLQKHDRFTSWRRQPHKSCDEIFTSSPFEENKFNWRRSHSQDSENFLKQRKDVSNFEKAQIGGPTTENGDGHGSSRFRQPSLPSVHAVQACSTQLLDNRLQEEGQKAKRTESQDSTQQRDSDGSIEKIDSEKGDSDGTEALTDNVMQLSIKDECSTEDILKETFPANSQADTDDDLLASMEDTLAESEIEADERTFENGGSGDTSCLNETVIHRPDAVCLPEICLPEKADSELSVEDEQDLEANAKIIVSELFIEREMSNSMLEEDMFIENETISLVSNGYNSDTASEVSISWSTSSKTNSEQASEYAASNTSQNENRSIKGPKITKPSDKDNGQQNTKEDNTRAIRGRRKPLYPGNRATSTPVSKAASSSNDSSRIAKANNSTFKAPWNKTPPGAANKKISPKGQGTNQNATKSSPKSKFNKTNTVSTPRPNTNNQRNNVPRVGSQSRLPTASGDKASPPAAKTKGKPSPPERPKPPIKQATFVKEPSGVVSAQSQLTKQQSAGSKSDVSTEGVKLREKKSSTSSSTPSDRHSGGSSGGSQRNSGEAWEKALGGHNFLVDKSQEQGLHAPYEQIQMQKNSNDCPEVLRRNSSNVTKTTTTTITVKISGNSPSGISRIATSNLRKTSSMSPSRCGSSSALNRTGSAGSLRKAGSKQELKKSDSNVSLKKGSNNNSRPSTPSGRRTPTSLNFNGKSQGSPCGTPTKRNETGAGSVRKGAPGSAGKKQITSKIASLWKKDDGGNSSGNSSDKSPPESRIPPKGSRVPSAKKPALPVKPKVIPVKSGQKHSPPGTTPPPQREGISRSSTYDKITLAGEPETRTVPDAAAGEEGNNDSANSSTGESPIARESSTFKEPHPVRLDFDSSTWTKDKTRDPTSLPDSDDTFDGSVWRRYDSDQEEDNTADVWVKQGSSITETTPCESGRVAAPCGNSGQSTLDSSSLSDKSLSNNNNNSSSSLANRSLVANTSMMNSSTASTTSTGRRLVRNFGSSALHKAKLSSQVIMANGCSEVEDEAKVLRHVQTPPQFTPNAEQGKNGLEGRIGNTAAAIVAPFNYKPSPIATTAAVSNSTNDQDRQPPVSSPGKRSLVGSPTKHMTKTEMLLARRRSYLNSTKNEENSCEGEEKKRTCLVTTV